MPKWNILIFFAEITLLRPRYFCTRINFTMDWTLGWTINCLGVDRHAHLPKAIGNALCSKFCLGSNFFSSNSVRYNAFSHSLCSEIPLKWCTQRQSAYIVDFVKREDPCNRWHRSIFTVVQELIQRLVKKKGSNTGLHQVYYEKIATLYYMVC